MAADVGRLAEEETEEPELNMTPMIDVTFQLLIFFILGAKFREPEGRLDAFLPQDGGPDKGVDAVEDVRITIRHLGLQQPDVLIELGENRERGVRHLFEAAGVLKQWHDAQPDLGLVIVSEGEIKFHWIITALNSSARAGYRKISFAAPIPSALSPEDRARGRVVNPLDR